MTDELSKIEMENGMRDAAHSVWIYYYALVREGFTTAQAMELTLAMQANAINQPSAPQPPPQEPDE